MTNKIHTYISPLFLISIIVFIGCGKINQPPDCNIIIPTNEQNVIKGTSLTIIVEAIDNDGNISKVIFLVDNKEKGSSNSSPYTYNWDTRLESLGNHTVKVICVDNDENTTSDEIIINIIESNWGIGEPCPEMPFVTDIDGNVYNTIKIGTQCWMKENLKTTRYNDGSSITNVPGSWSYATTGAYVWYNNDISRKDIYGGLYNWFAVEYENLCPTGWHVPTQSEWMTLNSYLGELRETGGKLKEAGTAHWDSPNVGATNETGFSALPGGHYRINEFSDLGHSGTWWSNTEQADYSAWRVDMYSHGSNLFVATNGKGIGSSIRCLKD